jgi:hypothetical protein
MVPIALGKAIGRVEVDEIEGAGRKGGKNLLGDSRPDRGREQLGLFPTVALADSVQLLAAQVGAVA